MERSFDTIRTGWSRAEPYIKTAAEIGSAIANVLQVEAPHYEIDAINESYELSAAIRHLKKCQLAEDFEFMPEL